MPEIFRLIPLGNVTRWARPAGTIHTISGGLMSKKTFFRAVGLAAALALIVVTWQYLPSATAENFRKSNIDNAPTASAVSTASDDDSLILLNARRINVHSDEAQAERLSAAASFDGKRMHLVRFRGAIQPDWFKMLKDSGVEIVDYIPNYTYLIYGDSNSIGNIQAVGREAASPIEWDGVYQDQYRLSPMLYDSNEKTGVKKLTSDQVQIQLVKDEVENAATFDLINSVQTQPVKGRQEISHYVNFVVGLDEGGITKLMQRPDVISIYPYFEPVKLDERQDIVLTGNWTGNGPTPSDYLAYLAAKGFTQAQFDASGFLVDLTDSGVDTATPASPNQFVLRAGGIFNGTSRFMYSRLEGTAHTGSTLQGCDGHGNLNASIIGGYVPGGGVFAAAPHADANGFRYGLGVAPFVKIGSSVIFDPAQYTSPNLTNLQSKAYNDGARISSNSWGSANNAYTADAKTYDMLVRDAQPAGSTFPTAGNQEMVIVFAAGNNGSGSNTVGSPSTGKNVITVGASEGVQAFGGADQCGVSDAQADSAMDIIPFSSRGPTSDQRKKPDIMLPGTHVSGSVAQIASVDPTLGSIGAQLTCFDASGVCAGTGTNNFFPVGQQWYTASSGTSHSTPAISGVAALMRQDFINRGLTPPSPAMTKAMLMNSAKYMTGAGANDSLPSNNQGMGLANLNNYFDIFAQNRIIRDQVNADRFTASGQQRVITGNVVDNSKPFRVTLAYTDKDGSTTGDAFVNNLDLEVTVGGNTYLGNVFTGANSSTGGSADIRNNAESVFIPAGVSGNFVIKVKATNIAGDGVPNNADALDQDFALVVSNANEATLPVFVGGTTAITAESCGLPNNSIDPSETVTINFPLSNIGTANTTNLVATLQATGGVSAPSGPQNYGALTANGAQVTKSFSFTANTNCGDPITATFQLQDGATNLGTITFKFTTGALGAPTTVNYSSGNLATAIPDGGSVDIPINVPDIGVVNDVNVKFRANHTFDGDVSAALVSPTGTTIPLVSRRGSGGDNFGTGANDCSGTFTVFDDSAGTAISLGAPPYAGSFKPESPLTGLNGQATTGTWILRVTDSAAQDTGTVGCVQLEINRLRYVCCGVAGDPAVASGGAAVLTAEGFSPPNNTPDPGETVTANFPIINSGLGNTTNLVATLQASGGITPVTTSQNYGAVAAAGPPVSKAFTFVANGNCGDMVTATLHFQDGALDLGSINYTFRLGTFNTQDTTFSNPAAITIPATGAGSPYPSNITVAGVTGNVSKVSVTLTNISHTFPSDVDVLLVGPTGQKFIVMSDVIGSTDWTGQTITLDDAAAALVPSSGAPASGSFKPTNYTAGDTFNAPAPAGPYLTPATVGSDTFASAFGGLDPNGTWGLYVVDDASGDSGSIAGGWSLTVTTAVNVCSSMSAVRSRADFDGDGRTDLSVYRPSDGNWYIAASTAGISAINWGTATDIPVPGDYDNDHKADEAIYRPSTGEWFILNSSTSTATVATWGATGDFDGDNKADIAVYRPSNGTWYIVNSTNGLAVGINWGVATDLPVPGDYDGDHKTDVVVYRPSDGTWYGIYSSGISGGGFGINWGIATDKPVAADYDGDNKDDVAVFRPSEGNWYIIRSSNQSGQIVNWGAATDILVPGDYDGDNTDDVAIYRPSSGEWFVLRSTSGLLVSTWGGSTDKPVPAAYIP
jgi:subtilisin-like proprotein convertase family protein